jgi:galactose mutarotase-like enzyme
MPKFVCIEPWQSTPSPAEGGNVWEEKPAAAVLQPGETYETCLKTTFTGV